MYLISSVVTEICLHAVTHPLFLLDILIRYKIKIPISVDTPLKLLIIHLYCQSINSKDGAENDVDGWKSIPSEVDEGFEY